MQIQKMCGAVIVVAGVTIADSRAADLRPLTDDCETALALSGAPEHLWQEAGVYVLGETGYELRRKPGNGFACIVERNHADSLIPQCFDAASFDANLKAILDTGTRIREGKSFEQIAELRQQALDRGDYASASHGIVYMISDFNFIYNENTDTMLDVEPHLMFHAPGLSAEDAGIDNAAAVANRGLPMLNAPGPHGFLITFVEKPSASYAVENECRGQLPDRSRMKPFPDWTAGDGS